MALCHWFSMVCMSALAWRLHLASMAQVLSVQLFQCLLGVQVLSSKLWLVKYESFRE